jgi:hypothetical protein
MKKGRSVLLCRLILRPDPGIRRGQLRPLAEPTG